MGILIFKGFGPVLYKNAVILVSYSSYICIVLSCFLQILAKSTYAKVVKPEYDVVCLSPLVITSFIQNQTINPATHTFVMTVTRDLQ